jgi:N-acetylglucosamine kinase-like BadF-type ATPase
MTESNVRAADVRAAVTMAERAAKIANGDYGTLIDDATNEPVRKATLEDYKVAMAEWARTGDDQPVLILDGRRVRHVGP